MNSYPETLEIRSPYNGPAVMESAVLTTTLDQYWLDRETAYSATLAQLEERTANPEAERRWHDFCAHRTGFLNRLLKAGAKAATGSLHELWGRKLGLAREARRAFENEARAELWIPFERLPLKFACVSSANSRYVIRESPNATHPDNFEIGKAHVAVFLRDECLFLILPSFDHVEMKTFTYTKGEFLWDTGAAFPIAFSDIARGFAGELEDAECSFAPLRQQWDLSAQTARVAAGLARLRVASEVWSRVRIPDEQKLEMLIRAELFEKGDPAAPSGLLLWGSPGNGKGLLLEALEATLDCDFQMLSPADLKHPNLGASGRIVKDIWKRARERRPAVIALDEFEGILGKRGAPETDVISAEILRAFLAEWQDSEDTAGIWLIGATNRRDLIDDAILSRFGWEMELGLPNREMRLSILTQEIAALGVGIDLPEEIGALTQGMSGRDLHNLAKSIRAIAYPEIPLKEHFLEAVRAARRTGTTRVDRKASWETLVVDPEVLERLKLICLLLRDAERWKQKGVSIPRSLLLIGPSGVGKTEIARTLANESGLTFLAATTADAKAPFLGWSGQRIRDLFERGRSSSPCIVFLDELDIIAPDRSLPGVGDALTNELQGQLLQEIDGIRASDAALFLLAATNHVDRIDPAIQSRFRERIVIPLPDRDARVRLLSIMLADKKLGFPLGDGALLLSNLVEGRNWSGRDLDSWVAAAEQKALLRAVRSGGLDHYEIQIEDFALVVR